MVVQIVYVQSALVGYFIMIVIAGAGGIWISGNSILNPIPILNQFLPGGNLMVPFFLFGGLSSVIFLSSVIIKEKGVSKN